MSLQLASLCCQRCQARLIRHRYQQQQILVTDVEIRGRELVAYIQRRGTPLMTDYFGQLGLIHGVIASNEPDVATVLTIDVDGRNGFVVDMGDLMDFCQDRLDFETFRSRWRFFEP